MPGLRSIPLSALWVGSLPARFDTAGMPFLPPPRSGSDPSGAVDNGTEVAQEAVSDEIIVTATRSAAPLSRFPMSIAALPQKQIDDLGLRTISEQSSVRLGFFKAATSFSKASGIAETAVDTDETSRSGTTSGSAE